MPIPSQFQKNRIPSQFASPPTSSGNDLTVTAPAGPGVPYINPQSRIAAEDAMQREAASRAYREAQLKGIRAMYGPLETGFISAGNEMAQPVFGALIAASKFNPYGNPNTTSNLQELYDRWQHGTDMLTEARPIAAPVGASAPYMISGPAAQRGYMSLVNKMRPGFMQRMAAGPLMSSIIPGSIEGATIAGLNPHQSAAQGALLSAGGNYLGQLGTRAVAKQPVNLTPYDEQMLNIAKDWDIRMMPGAKSGNIGYMQVDDALLKSPKSNRALSHIPMEQERTITRKVLGVAGLDADSVKAGDLWNHKSRLGKEFDKLEKNSTPIFSQDTTNGIADTRRAYDDLSPTNNHKWINELEAEFNKIGGRNPNGEIDLYDYQGFKNRLNSIIKGFRGKPLDGEQTARLSVAENYMALLRDAMRKGTNDPDILKKWDALNSKYAATNFIMDHNIIGQDGVVDYDKLWTAMNNRKSKQLYSMQGPWEDMAKAAHLGAYINNTLRPTLGAHHQINKFMGARQNKGILGTIINFGGDTRLMPDFMVNWYRTMYPKRGPWRLPEESVLWGGNAVSAAARGGPLMIDTGIPPEEKQ